jgi:hypothetical protein
MSATANDQSRPFLTARRTFLSAVAAGALAAPAALAQDTPAPFPGGAANPLSAQSSLEDLLRAANVPYTPRQKPTGAECLIQIQTDAGSTDLVARELQMRWRRRDGSPVRAMYVYATVAKFPPDFTPSLALLKHMADTNNDLAFGSVGLAKNGVFYSNSLWLQNADPELLADVLAMSHAVTQSLRREIQPMVPRA